VAAGAATVLVSAFGSATQMGLTVLHPIRGTLFAVFFGALTVMSARPAQGSVVARFFRASWLRTLGKYSYGLYVYHGLLSFYMLELHAQDRLQAVLGSHSLAIAAQTVLGVGVSLAVAALSYELFEKRFLALKRLFERESASPAPAAQPPVVAASPVDRRLD
jgi:peptidoglycan/LPS O-acetylase OafA/YrhL